MVSMAVRVFSNCFVTSTSEAVRTIIGADNCATGLCDISLRLAGWSLICPRIARALARFSELGAGCEKGTVPRYTNRLGSESQPTSTTSAVAAASFQTQGRTSARARSPVYEGCLTVCLICCGGCPWTAAATWSTRQAGEGPTCHAAIC